MSLRVMLVDDHKLVREALSYLLSVEDDIEVVGVTGDGFDALDLAERIKPDVVIMDIEMPGMNGIEITRRLIAQQPELKVIALSGYVDRNFIDKMLHAGAVAYVSKSTAAPELFNALRAVEKNEPYFCPETLQELMDSLRQSQTQATPVVSSAILTTREREVLCLLAQGKRSSEIAWQLYIAVSTVDVHRRNIMNKLDLHNVAELTKYAIRAGLIKP